MFDNRRLKKTFLMAAKIGIGSSIAIYIAQMLKLDNATSAGTITLLTLMTTKWETVKLSGYRLITYFVTVFVAWVVFMHVDIVWFSYGLFIFTIVFLAEYFGLATTISVNSVIGAHLLITHDFSIHSIENELILVLIGISVALILNQYQDNKHQEKHIKENMRYTEARLQKILLEFAQYLMKIKTSVNVWEDIQDLEKKILEFQKEAYEYMNNTFHSRTEFYFNYFDMR